MLRERLVKRLQHHRKAAADAHRLAQKYLNRADFNEAARWADAAKSHRFVAEVLTEVHGG